MSTNTYAGYTGEQIRAAALAATQGPWSVPDGADEIIAWVEIPVGGALNCGPIHCDHSLPNARHIATANPETVIALLDRISKLERAQAEPVAWSVNKKTVMHLAAELVRGAVCMADDETELTLEILAAGTVQDDDGSVNANPVLALSIADYREEGVYPIDPCNPTAGREPKGGAA
ncbi:ead/Ea22-like family protein [Laribacter hongkongensis]|uniref:ead/Ea22-like family protein n=1 Tax=Laribacter hongkongensis TaxID=168471 RepID=UPI001EFDC10C|nr:ead/Ea22-like family protein [Laribacter hongkongensis]MCG9081260.1 ead/Ea22-like family protein [Laribacter hongkongensis]